LVRFPFMAGVGMVVLLGELCRRVTVRADGRALWTGFTQRPFDLRDWDAEMSELGLDARVERRLVDFDASPQLRREAFAAGLDRAEALRDEGCDVLVVLLCEPGFESDVDASLVRLSGKHDVGSITTIVVTPFPEKREAVWIELSPPFKAQIVGLSMAKRMVGGVLRRSRFTETWSVCEPMPEPWVASTRSRPTQKARPAPVSTTARTLSSARPR